MSIAIQDFCGTCNKWLIFIWNWYNMSWTKGDKSRFPIFMIHIIIFKLHCFRHCSDHDRLLNFNLLAIFTSMILLKDMNTVVKVYKHICLAEKDPFKFLLFPKWTARVFTIATFFFGLWRRKVIVYNFTKDFARRAEQWWFLFQFLSELECFLLSVLYLAVQFFCCSFFSPAMVSLFFSPDILCLSLICSAAVLGGFAVLRQTNGIGDFSRSILIYN